MKLPKSLPSITWTPESSIRVLIIFITLIAVLFLQEFRFFQRLEYVTYDYRCLLRDTRPSQPEIAVIEISDDSVAKIGRWPWDRDWHASLVSILTKLGAKAIVFDVIFSEASTPEKDTVLSEAVQKSGKVYLAEVVQEVPSLKKKESS